MSRKDGISLQVDEHAPSYELGLASKDDANVLGMLHGGHLPENPRLTFHWKSENRLQARASS